ncbi:MAG: UDP-N-acetylmuramoyl-tripeptide--D-alanyl-D-alanine ligase [Pseudomonadota bacterium]
MIGGTLSEAAAAVAGQHLGADGRYLGLSTDSRTLREGELFVALDGPNFAGRDFVAAAAKRGAAGAVVMQRTDDTLVQIEVEDSLTALGALGASWRQQMQPRVVGLTGSNGKTTLKELILSCLSRSAKTLATEGNLNNEIGVPLMLSRLSQDDHFAIFEMGANHAGEIAYLTDLVQPAVVAITNAAQAHLEGFGSLDGVARAKGEILCGRPRPDIAILNADDRYFDFWCSLAADVTVLSFGVEQPADVRGRALQEHADGVAFELCLPDETVPVRLPLAGRHNVLNAAAAAAIAVALDIDVETIVAGLESVNPVSGRLKPVQLSASTILFDDSYNANPASVVAAAQFLSSRSESRWLVLGDMAELGADASTMHAEVGQRAKAAGVDRLFATGDLSRHTVDGFGDGAAWHSSMPALIDALSAELSAAEQPTAILVKGSRSARMERAVNALCGERTEGGT